MASPRKSWDQLSDNYRRRLTRAGITPEQHAQGAGLSKARGHTSRAKENARRRQLKSLQRFAQEYAKKYHLDEADVLAQMKALSTAEALAHMRGQERAEELYDEGHLFEATDVYTRNRYHDATPEWMFYYHGVFH